MYFRELYLDGNNLECEGLIELIKICAEHAEIEHYEREEEAIRKAEEEEEAARLSNLKSIRSLDHYF